ncbi:uncharacterized protein LOC124910101 [Impatiens glandulifera]|uniref:uncharacterized protein LOC124910101 n=1 Tax=Impatiens glandulifera TaxID=253017 RepID=UPI001FB13357|nr:uncharacterized protein LOC124910101 [Impatiens glandulifera]
MECLCLASPVVSIFLRRRRRGRRYQRLSLSSSEEEEEVGQLVTVVAGKDQKMKFLVDRLVLDLNPFRILMESTLMTKKNNKGGGGGIIFMDVDSILIEHILWLIKNDSSSLSNLTLNLTDILDFYTNDD